MKIATTIRPAPFGGLPSGVAWHYIEAPQDGRTYQDIPRSRYRYGVIQTDRDLTTDEIDRFDLVEVD